MRKLFLTLALIVAAISLNAQGRFGSSRFEPDNRTFFKQAREEFGLFPAIIFTSDRLTRGGRIGTAGVNMAGEDGLIHEGIDAYRFRWKDASVYKMVPKGKGGTKALPLPADGSGIGKYASKDFDFVDYLLGNDMGDEALKLLSDGSYHPSDSLSYLRAWTDYSLKLLPEAAAEFSQVPFGSPFYDKSLFFNVISNAHLGNWSRCEELLDSYSGPYKELEALERAGMAMICNDRQAFLEASRSFSFSHYLLSESEREMQQLYTRKFERKEKNPWLAAGASAIVPGLGKIYAGELGEGVASFLAVAALSAITAENWKKNGATNWKTILFGTAGTIFHLGNIYGSYISVGIHNDFINNELDTAILYNMHIPLRSFFD
ncbi:MAG: hypothetical protein PUC53_03750 [Bacteroidales bacterium]|nr:hypothetical protein [Bacteroidales bacterium]